MKRRMTFALAAVACAVFALIGIAEHGRINKGERKTQLQSFSAGHESKAEDSQVSIERLKHELAELESTVPPNDREKRRYSADSQEPNLADGTIHLKGRVWHRDGVSLTDGRADPRSSMTIASYLASFLMARLSFRSRLAAKSSCTSRPQLLKYTLRP